MTALLELATRCEQATGPDAKLDRAILDALYPKWVGRWLLGPTKYRFTASLDAAMTLVPEGHDYILEHVNGGLTIGARVGHNDPDRTSWGETDALALCAAIIRTQAASEQQV